MLTNFKTTPKGSGNSDAKRNLHIIQNSLKAVFSVGLIASMGFTSLQAQEVKVTLEPHQSQRILGWENGSETAVSTWQIDIAEGYELNGTMSYTPILQHFQEKNYLKLDAEFMTNPGYFYKITPLDANGNVIGTGSDYKPTMEGPQVTTLDKQKCVSYDLAYEIDQLHKPATNGTPGHYYLSLGNTAKA
jgi:hypothetical protein